MFQIGMFRMQNPLVFRPQNRIVDGSNNSVLKPAQPTAIRQPSPRYADPRLSIFSEMCSVE
jgi:hypothetical protein